MTTLFNIFAGIVLFIAVLTFPFVFGFLLVAIVNWLDRNLQ